jgi:transcriptional regulator with GAF, ATPase, and Fis domain
LNPRLVAVAGPLAGSTLALGAAAFTLGRQGGCDLQIRDLAVSRQHCVLTPLGAPASPAPDDGRFVLRDLESRHGTFVNGVPIRERVLEPGDRIHVGSSLFLFETGETGEAGGGPEAEAGLLDPGDYVAESTVHWPLGTPQLDPAALAASLAAVPPAGDPGRAERDLAALLKASEELGALGAESTVEPLARRLLDLVFEVAPAGRAALLLLDRDGEPAAAFARDRRGGTVPFPVSRTLLRQAVGERAAILATDLLTTPDLREAESVQAERLRSLLAIPLLVSPGSPGSEPALGLLYADIRATGAQFDERHLALLAAAARTAALALLNLRRMAWLEGERSRLLAAVEHDMVGESPRMKEVYRLLARVAPTASTVLLRGESGTGKELAARALHDGSPRSGRPFVAINCATLSETLLESELFGHEKGAFTGAVERKIGKLEVADTGTVFLDEVGEIPLPLQAKLLRALEEREFERVGGTRPIRVDVRLVAATHRDLEKSIREGTFRADLYYRLSVITLHLPPLRERRLDIPLLASHFAARVSRDLGRPVAGFSAAARACLERYSWPGNVRELKNAVERAVVLGEGDLIVPEDLPEALLEVATAPGTEPGTVIPRFHGAVNDFKKRLILNAVKEARGNVSQAAHLLGLHPNYLHRLITNLELRAALEDI